MSVLSMREKAWSPYQAGIVIGLLQIPAFLLIGTALGASSSFVTVSGWAASLVDPGVWDNGYFAKYMTGSKYAWQTALVVGIALGAFISARMSGAARRAISPVWERAVGVSSLPGRMAMGFAGGFLLLLGARIAGGCTSGHGISGIAQLAIGSMTAVAAMFAGGILVAALFRKV